MRKTVNNRPFSPLFLQFGIMIKLIKDNRDLFIFYKKGATMDNWEYIELIDAIYEAYSDYLEREMGPKEAYVRAVTVDYSNRV